MDADATTPSLSYVPRCLHTDIDLIPTLHRSLPLHVSLKIAEARPMLSQRIAVTSQCAFTSTYLHRARGNFSEPILPKNRCAVMLDSRAVPRGEKIKWNMGYTSASCAGILDLGAPHGPWLVAKI